MQAQRYGYTQMINNATLTNSSYKLRLAQDITLYLAEIGMDIDGWNDELGKKAWLEDGIWQGTREAVETIMGSPDYLEQYFATNIVFEPLVGELFRSGFLMQVAAANHDFITPPVISAAEADYERNLANAIDLMYLLANDEQHGGRQSAAVPGLARQARRPGPQGRRGAAADLVAAAFQAGLVRGRPGQCRGAARQDRRRTRPEALNREDTDMSIAARGATHSNVFKSMKDITFEQTISHQCGVTMNNSVEARAIAEFMAEKPDVTVTYQPALIRIDGTGKLVFKMDEISEYLGREMTAPIFEVNTSTHYGRMVRVDDNTVILFGNMDDVFEYI